MVVGGDVGDGMFGEGYGDVLEGWPDPFMAARCDDDSTALSAALEGSKVCSTIIRSCVVCRWVGDVVLGVVPSMIFLVEYCLLRGFGPVDDGVGAGGDIVASNVYDWPLLTCGRGCWASLASRRAGSISSRSLRKSSASLRRSCSKRCIRSSRIRSCSTRCLLSFSVAVAYCASASAAVRWGRVSTPRSRTGVGERDAGKNARSRTKWHVVVALYRDILGFLDIVNAL